MRECPGGWPSLSRSLRRLGLFSRHSGDAGHSHTISFVPWGLKRYQQTRQLHFTTFSCYHRAPLLGTEQARDPFVSALERVRQWYGFYMVGYVVMPEHVHLLMGEPERGSLALVLQTAKQIVSRKLRAATRKEPFWQPRYYDFNVGRRGSG